MIKLKPAVIQDPIPEEETDALPEIVGQASVFCGVSSVVYTVKKKGILRKKIRNNKARNRIPIKCTGIIQSLNRLLLSTLVSWPTL